MVDTGAKWRFLVVEPGADWISAIVDDYRTKNGSEPSAIYAGSMDNPVPLGDACKWAVQRRRESAAHGPGCWFKYRSMDDGKILVLATGRYIPYGKARELARKAAEIVHANVDMPFRCYRPAYRRFGRDHHIRDTARIYDGYPESRRTDWADEGS